MKLKEIYDVLVQLENLKQIARVKQYAHLNDPLNKQKKKAFEEAHKEWVDQFELSQNVMNKYISEEHSLFETSQTEKKIDHLSELVHADQERKRMALGVMPELCVKEAQPAPARIRDMVIDAIRAHDKKIDCYADNGCPHIGYIRVEDFEIWKDGICNEEDFNAAKNFYGGGTDE